MYNYVDDIFNYISMEIDALRQVDLLDLNRAINILLEARQNQTPIYVFGNGGSGATAAHIEGDFNKGVSLYTGIPFDVHCLNDNIPTILAIANDIDYSEIFKVQLENRLKNGDIVIAISGSGNSENIIKAVEYAEKAGAFIIGMTGFDGGRLKDYCDIELRAPALNMQIVEDVHLMFNHLMMWVLCHIWRHENEKLSEGESNQ